MVYLLSCVGSSKDEAVGVVRQHSDQGRYELSQGHVINRGWSLLRPDEL